MEGDPIQLVPMEWPHGLDKSGILSLLYMPHFGCTTEVNMCVKYMLVCFNGVCLWLDNRIFFMLTRLLLSQGYPRREFIQHCYLLARINIQALSLE